MSLLWKICGNLRGNQICFSDVGLSPIASGGDLCSQLARREFEGMPSQLPSTSENSFFAAIE